MTRPKAMTQDLGRVREREKQELRARVGEHRHDTPSSLRRVWKSIGVLAGCRRGLRHMCGF